MSWEEDYLMAKARELESRVAALEAACPGMSSSASISSEPTNSGKNASSLQQPAPTTASLSGKGRTESSTAPSTAGSGRATPSEPGTPEDGPEAMRDEPGEEDVPPYPSWSAQELRDELAARGLSTSGRKDELVARLEADDES